MNNKVVLVCGAGGFIGGHMANKQVLMGNYVIGVDIKKHDHTPPPVHEFLLRDLRDFENCMEVTRGVDEVWQFAADMGGAGYIFTGDHDDEIMHNSATINLNMAEACKRNGVKRVFYSSSACMYPEHAQLDPANPGLPESCAYPAAPDSEYGWEKLFSERLWLAYSKHFDVRICRYHNIFGPNGTWRGGKEKAPAAMLRKAFQALDHMEVWGPGTQTRSFLYIEDCIRMSIQLMESNHTEPVNIGSEEMVSINALALMALDIMDKPHVEVVNIPGPVGVAGRNSDNTVYIQKVGPGPRVSLRDGMELTGAWIADQIRQEMNT